MKPSIYFLSHIDIYNNLFFFNSSIFPKVKSSYGLELFSYPKSTPCGIDLNLAYIHISNLDVETDFSLAVYNDPRKRCPLIYSQQHCVCFFKSGIASTVPKIYLALVFLCLLTPFPWRVCDRQGQGYKCHMIRFSRETSGGRVSAQSWLVESK